MQKRLKRSCITIDKVNRLLEKYPIDMEIMPDEEPWYSQYDPRSAKINYAMVRHYKPTKIVEFGSRTGRCTRDILKALLDNKQKFIFKPYEIESALRSIAQNNLNQFFIEDSVKIGKDILKAKDLPDDIDYLFVDNSHDYRTTKWVFEYLLPKKCKLGALVHFHDMVIIGDYQFTIRNGIPDKDENGELYYFYKLIKKKKLPLDKVYWTWEENINASSTWWRYMP